MKTELIYIDENKIDETAIKKAGMIIKTGGLVAFPTETVYGLGADALNSEGAFKIYKAKGRPSDNPLIIHIAKLEDLEKIVKSIPEQAYKLAEAFWPGPLTMIFEKSNIVPKETTGGLNTVAVRMPNHSIALELIKASGGYIAAPSANVSGKPSPTLAKHVMKDLEGSIEMILDSGSVGIGLESTIVDLTGKEPIILRPGYITGEMIGRIIGKVGIDLAVSGNPSDAAPKAPGMKYKHYAPIGELTIIEGEVEAVVSEINRLTTLCTNKGKAVGVIATDETIESYQCSLVKSIGSRNDETSIARRLYALLREFDDIGVEYIYSEAFYTPQMGQAIMNRLLKAAGYKVIHI